MLRPVCASDVSIGTHRSNLPFDERKQVSSGGGERVTATAATREITPLATFFVDKPVLSSGVVRHITLFPISLRLNFTDQSLFTAPDVPKGPHEKLIYTGVKRNQWNTPSSVPVDRRYSELVELRELLAYQFPIMIVPPLPQKSKLENFATFQRNENILLTQQYTIVRFLREVAMMPELMFYSVYMPSFFEMPRETFEEWFAAMQMTLADFRRCNSSINAHSVRRGGLLGFSSVTTFTDKSTNVVRKIVGMFHSLVGGSGAPQRQLTQHERCNCDNGRHRHYSTPLPANLSASMGASIAYWDEQIAFLSSYRTSLLESARQYLIFIENSVDTLAAMKEVVEAFEKYADVLGASPANQGLALLVGEASRLAGQGAVAMKGMHARQKREMYERMLFEVSYIDAALGTIDHVLCMWHHCSGGVNEPTYLQLAEYADDVSNKLRAHYEKCFLTNFSLRMHNMIFRNVESEYSVVKKLDEGLKGSNLAMNIRDPSWSEYKS